MIKNHYGHINHPQAEWTAPPRAPAPDGMFFCKYHGFNITVCRIQETCPIKKCQAKGGDKQ